MIFVSVIKEFTKNLKLGRNFSNDYIKKNVDDETNIHIDLFVI
jgi:hypothetical protein